MRCSICLEEMAHPGPGLGFSCPNKYEGWHTREYRRLALQIALFEDTPGRAYNPTDQIALDRLIALREDLKKI